MPSKITRTVATLFATTLAALITTATPAAATHGSVPCEVPNHFKPLFQLIHDVAQLAQLAGIVLGFLGFTIAGLMILMPGQEWSRRGKKTAKAILSGVVILLSARLVMEFLIGYFPVC